MASVDQQCPICRATASVEDHGALAVRCRFCGNFSVSHSCNANFLGPLTDDDRFKLYCLMAERWRKKGPTTLFFTDMPNEPAAPGRVLTTVADYLKSFPKAPSDYYDRALLNFATFAEQPTDIINVSQEIMRRVIFARPAVESPMLVQLTASGFIRQLPGNQNSYIVTTAGWERIEKIRAPGRDSRRAFVAMWFDKSRDAFFENGIKPAVEADGMTIAVRIDNKEHNGKIDDEIVAEIRRSRYLIADFTGDRGGIYFEAGFALGLALPVIWCVAESDVAKLHFDTRQYNHIVYSSPEDLRVKLLNRIRATIV